MPEVREALEKGLTAGGLHLSEGAKVSLTLTLGQG